MRYALLEMRHQHQVSSLGPAVVKSVMVNVTQHSTCSYPVCRVVFVDVFAQRIQLDFARFCTFVLAVVDL